MDWRKDPSKRSRRDSDSTMEGKAFEREDTPGLGVADEKEDER